MKGESSSSTSMIMGKDIGKKEISKNAPDNYSCVPVIDNSAAFFQPLSLVSGFQ